MRGSVLLLGVVLVSCAGPRAAGPEGEARGGEAAMVDRDEMPPPAPAPDPNAAFEKQLLLAMESTLRLIERCLDAVDGGERDCQATGERLAELVATERPKLRAELEALVPTASALSDAEIQAMGSRLGPAMQEILTATEASMKERGESARRFQEACPAEVTALRNSIDGVISDLVSIGERIEAARTGAATTE